MSSFLSTRVVNHHLREIVPPMAPVDSKLSSLGLSMNFFNGLNRDVVVINRFGVRYRIPSDPLAVNRNLIIRYTDRAHCSVISTTEGLWSVDGQIMKGAGQRTLANTFGNEPTGRSFRSRAVDCVVSPEELHHYGPTLYLRELDIVVTTAVDDPRIYHPFSAKGQENGLCEYAERENRDGFHFRIRIIDHNGVYGPRYVNLAGQVFKVPVGLDDDLDDGVYLTRSPAATSEITDGTGAYSERFDFSEADAALKLYRTYAEAAALGSPEEALNRELQERKQALALAEIQFKELKAQRDAERDQHARNLEREREEAKRKQALLDDELSRRKFELTRAETQSSLLENTIRRDTLRIKEHYEVTGARRKESLELLKFVPALLLAGYAAYQAYKKVTDK